jgi:DNA-binding PadR family transcriptional regulator
LRGDAGGAHGPGTIHRALSTRPGWRRLVPNADLRPAGASGRVQYYVLRYIEGGVKVIRGAGNPFACRNVPRREASLFDRSVLVLTSLTGGEKHGYALIKDIEEFAGVTLGPGTLYAALARLERDHLVEPLPAEARRRPYRITQAGRELLSTELKQSDRIVKLGLTRMEATH